MNAWNANLLQNATFVRPEYFYISGFSGIPYVKYYFMFLFFTYFMAVFGNSFVILMICTDRSLHTPKYMGIFSLALADFGETNALVPNMMKTFLFDSQYISYEACLANMFFAFFFCTVQSFTLVVLAYDRFIAICSPLKYHALVSHAFMSVALMAGWLLSTVMIGTMVGMVTRLSFCKINVVKSYFCDHGPLYTTSCNDNSINLFMAMLCTAVCIYVPLIVITASYLGILLALSKVTTWAGRFKALRTCISHLLIVGLFYVPAIGIYMAALTLNVDLNTRIISTSLSSTIPPMLNPVIYVLSTKEFKNAILKMFKTKSNIKAQLSAQ